MLGAKTTLFDIIYLYQWLPTHTRRYVLREVFYLLCFDRNATILMDTVKS
ncbi:hypothetical protein PP241_gp26 [Streptococcus phage P7601]|uniref:Uncharacterized protein n=4 Tax=Moineauvirus TaxID=1623304 RepID=A0A286QQF8_9CAUD|nr:hypothetical protein PP236_gp29 [Streptococcus phage P7151]YP_010647107.1 hypothetical protein PP238_gp25 [Streptococcus phage P7154]YP_010647247.1 hypothetical protein PP241_gp26 [Streptococcus phage P7601]YP_010647441.1 hypothetical protein PP245_gp23 [Streptococcus phage P7633]ARU13469.1 hypothetical protein P5652_26 [Streptococcus phage P5652]ARU14446.1 hypothetical protein P8921_27 [Streptococcus phage P8921]ARU13646.1 hypothetical protein P7151_29 [Streptococcus phage P7151]ARU13735